MSTTALRVGDRVDWHGFRDGEVKRVGLGTVWADFDTGAGRVEFAAPKHEVKPARASCDSVKIGAFMLQRLGNGRVYLRRGAGEGMETDEARLEGWLEKFWHREF